jgi:sodium-dependent dicarboxylate transporter 2/3/5
MTYTYIYERWPVIILFISGYILFRVVDSVGIPEYVSKRSLAFSGGRVPMLLLCLIAVCAGLSMFIPNTVTVLAMLPVIRMLNTEYPDLTTPLTLSIIYGSNIGGMGSLIGSPANMLLIGALDFLNVPGRMQITFFNWLLWAVPVAILFLFASWGLVLFSVPKGVKKLRGIFAEPVIVKPELKAGGWIFVSYILFWSLSSVAAALITEYKGVEPVVCSIYFISFIYFVFIHRIQQSRGIKPVLSFRDMLRGVPSGGIKILILLVLIAAVVRFTGIGRRAVELLSKVLENQSVMGAHGYIIYISVALSVIFLTEAFSNTLVSTAFFPIVYLAAVHTGVEALPLMILVSICSTCAFMTPIATPCNSLAFGEMRGTSLRVMLRLGLLLNLVGALLLSLWMYKVYPLISG